MCNVRGLTLYSFSRIGLRKEDIPSLIKRVRFNRKAKNY